MITMQKILVATDFSECSEIALTYGRAIARQFNACLRVMHVVETSAAEAFQVGGYVTAIPAVQAELESSQGARLDALVSDDDRRHLAAGTVLVMFQPPAQAVVEYAAREQVDLIVVGTHGRRGLAHMVMGSVAERIVRTAPCPVLTVHHPEREFVTTEPTASTTST